jgi:hypothetical protein
MDRGDVKNSELLKAMAAVDAADPAADESTRMALLAAVYRALRRAMVVLPMHETSIALDEDQFFIRTRPGPDGKETITAYTDFEAAPADTRCHAMPFVEFCKRIASTGLVVAIWGAPRVGFVPAYWVRALADDAPEMPVPITVAAANSRIVKVEAINHVRSALMQRLVSGVTANPIVSAAYLVLATFEDEAGFLVGMVVDAAAELETKRRSLASEIYSWVAPTLRHGEEIFFFTLPADDPLVGRLKAVGPPFYRRAG